MKESPCCARFRINVRRNRAEVSRLAHIIEGQVTRNGSARPRYVAELAEAKDQVLTAQKFLDDHEADHADDRVSA